MYETQKLLFCSCFDNSWQNLVQKVFAKRSWVTLQWRAYFRRHVSLQNVFSMMMMRCHTSENLSTENRLLTEWLSVRGEFIYRATLGWNNFFFRSSQSVDARSTDTLTRPTSPFQLSATVGVFVSIFAVRRLKNWKLQGKRESQCYRLIAHNQTVD